LAWIRFRSNIATACMSRTPCDWNAPERTQVYEGLEACAGDGFTRSDTSPPSSRGVSSASSSPPESRAAADDPSMSSHGEVPFDKSSDRVGGGTASSIDWSGSTVKLVEDSVMVEGAGRRERECLRKFLGFRWNEDVKAMVRSSNEVMPLRESPRISFVAGPPELGPHLTSH